MRFFSIVEELMIILSGRKSFAIINCEQVTVSVIGERQLRITSLALNML